MRHALRTSGFLLVISVVAALVAVGVAPSAPPPEGPVAGPARQLQSAPFRGFGQQPRVRPLREVMVVDSKGKLVGATVGGMGMLTVGSSLQIRFIVLLQLDGLVVPVAVGRDRFYGGGVLYFEAEDCQGTPWFPVDTSSSETPILPRVGVGPPGQTLYIEAPSPPQPITVNSLLHDFSTCTNETFDDVSAQRANPLVDLTTEFTPPFSLRAAP